MKLGLLIYNGFCFFLLIVSGLFFLVGEMLFFEDKLFLVEWGLESWASVNISMMMILDWMSMVFLGSVCLISGCIMKYCEYYMEGEVYYYRFIYLVLMFVGSMWALIISPNLISILLGWDGLGLTSYLLVIFYQSDTSNNAGMLTLLSNRIGDASILMGIGIMFSSGGWDFYSLDSSSNFVLGLVCLAAMTKSAQIPFSAWLPAAMAAPTPVSALVHSSTLVTAGVYLLIRFEKLMSGSMFISVLMVSGVLTMFMAGLVANFESDLKKIVAFSTLSQLGLMIMILSSGFPELAFYHLITHAMFKSVLFMCVGSLIHDLGGSQDLGYSGSVSMSNPFLMMVFMVSNFSLCGAPFLSGFYSKDCIVEVMMSESTNLTGLIMLAASIGFTVSYTLRLVYKVGLSKSGMLSSASVKNMSLNLSGSMSALYLMSVVMGFLYFKSLLYSGGYVSLMNVEKGMVFMISVLSGLGMYNLSKMSISVKSSFYYSMWFMKYLSTKLMSKDVLSVSGSSLKSLDKGWLEFYGGEQGSNLVILVSGEIQGRQKSVMVKNYLLVAVLVMLIFLII